jgi:hypothetical protein
MLTYRQFMKSKRGQKAPPIDLKEMAVFIKKRKAQLKKDLATGAFTVQRKWPPTTLVIKENNTVGAAMLLKSFKAQAALHDRLMADAERAGQFVLFRAHTAISSGYHRAVRLLEKELERIEKAKR